MSSASKSAGAKALAPASSPLQIEVRLAFRDSVHLSLEVSEAGEILTSTLTGSGCTEFLKLMAEWRPRFKGQLAELPLPGGQTHSAILMRELILRAQGRWEFPYKDEELCHCRGVPAAVVDSAIIGGCHTVDQVKRATSASTSCGTCRWDIESILKYRLAEKP